MFKKHKVLWIVVAALFLVAGSGLAFFHFQPASPAQFLGSLTLPSKTVSSDELSFDYDITSGDVDYFTKNDTFETIRSSTPYYLGAQELGNPAFASFYELKKSKVEEAKELTGQLYQDTLNLQKELRSFRGAYLNFLDAAVKTYPELVGFGADAAKQFTKFISEEQLLQMKFESLKLTGLDELTGSTLAYQKTDLALQLSKTFYHDFASLMANGVQLQDVMQASDISTAKDAAKTFDVEMQKISNLKEAFSAVNTKAALLNVALKQINTADYYLAKANVRFVEQNVDGLKEKIQTIKPSDFVSAEDVVFMQKYADFYGSFAGEMEKKLAKVDQKKLLQKNSVNGSAFVPVARADFGDYLKSAKDVLKQGAQEMWDETKQGLNDDIEMIKHPSLAWNAIKKGYQDVKDEVKNSWEETKDGIKQGWQDTKDSYHAGQKIIGVVLDGAGAATKSVFDIGFNVMAGNSMDDIADEIADNILKVKENYDKGKSGTEILKTAEGYLNNVDNTFKDLGEGLGNGLNSASGDDSEWTPWVLGKVGQIGSGMFTSFGRGIYKLANQDSSAGDIAQGALDVGLSFIGGSKVILKGSQALGGAAEGADLVAASGLNFMNRLWNTLQTKGLQGAGKELLADDVMKYISNSLSIDGRNALGKALQDAGALLDKQFEKLMEDGGKAIIKNLTGGAAGSLEEFVEKGFANSMGGLWNGIKTVLAGGEQSIEGALDNYVGKVIDDAFGELVKNYIDGEGGLNSTDDGDDSDDETDMENFLDSYSDDGFGNGSVIDQAFCKDFSYGDCIDAAKILPGSVDDVNSAFYKAWAVCSKNNSVCEFGVDVDDGSGVISVPQLFDGDDSDFDPIGGLSAHEPFDPEKPFDGVYKGKLVAPDTEPIPVILTVKDGVVSGSISKTVHSEGSITVSVDGGKGTPSKFPVTATVVAAFAGNVTDKGVVGGTFGGTVSITMSKNGKPTPIPLGSSFEGSIGGNTMNIQVTVTIDLGDGDVMSKAFPVVLTR